MSVEEANQQVNNPNLSPAPNDPVAASTSQGGPAPAGTSPDKQSPTHKKAISAVLIVAVVIVVIAALWIAFKTLGTDQTTPPPPAPASQEVVIKGEKDLKALEDELNSLDFSDLEKDLGANDTDASKF